MIVASLTHFHSDLAFDFTPGAFSSGGAFWAGLGGGLLIGIYDYLGYNTTAYLGAEVKDPGRCSPTRSISVLGIMVIYLLMNIGVLGVAPWQEASKSDSVASLVLERTWGKTAADITTVLILVTAFGSVFAGLLGGSRVPYNAAKDGVFFKPFGRLQPRHRLPHVALLAMRLVMAVGTFFTLTTVISVLRAVFVIIQGIAQVVALTVLGYIYISASHTPIICSIVVIGAGVLAFLGWARAEAEWPFGPVPQASGSAG